SGWARSGAVLGTSLGAGRTSGLEPPARRATGLGSEDAVDGRRRDLTQVPRRRTGARRAVVVGERPVLDLGRPALVAVALRQSLEGGLVGHLGGRPLDRQVDAAVGERDRAARVLDEVLALARPVAAHDVDLAVIPQRSDAGEMGPAVGPRRRQERRLFLRRAALEGV